MRKKLLFLILIIHFAIINAFSSDISKGFVVTLTNDTIYGRIPVQSDIDFVRTLQFFDNEGKLTRYSANEISAFYLEEDNRLFEAKEILMDNIPGKYFLRCLVKGKTSLYLLRGDMNDNFYLQKGENFIELINTKTQKEIDGKLYNTFKYEYIYTLKTEILDDCPGLLTTADKLKYDEEDLVVFIQEVNICKSRENLYKSYLSKNKISINSGINLSIGTNTFWPAQGTSYGIGFYQEIKYPEFSKKIFLSYGVAFEYGANKIASDADFYKPGFIKFSVPFYFNFELGHHAIQPYLLAGLQLTNYLKSTLGQSTDPSQVSLDPNQSHLVLDPVLPLTIGGGIKTKSFNVLMTANIYDLMIRFVYYFKRKEKA